MKKISEKALKLPILIFQLFHHIYVELAIVSLLIVSINTYFGNSDTTINADGVGYYEYLPSIFIRGDFNRKDKSVSEDSTVYSTILEKGVYVNVNNRYLNKYPVGTALLVSPFFFFTKYNSTLVKPSGYEEIYQRTIFHAAIFYLFLTLVFFRKLLQLNSVRKLWIVSIQIILVFGTAVIHYVYSDSSFSHVYSLFTITAFLYFSQLYFKSFTTKAFVFSCLFLGLILLIRPINLIILTGLPFIAGSWISLKNGFTTFIKSIKLISIGCGIVLSLLAIQFLCWYYQTGYFIVDSYQGEKFDFTTPHFIDILFSYKKGLFIYTPIVFISLLSSFHWIVLKKYYLFFTWNLFFLFITFILSSWWSWFYGCSYSLRAYIDFYTILLLPLAIFLNYLKPILGVSLLVLSSITLPLNIIQTKQYKKFILHWIDMDKQKYWEVFLKTSPKYEGLVWKKSYNLSEYDVRNLGVKIEPLYIKENENKTLLEYSFDSLSRWSNPLTLIQLSFSNHFYENDDSKIEVAIINKTSNKIEYYHELALIKFREEKLGTYQTGKFCYEIPAITALNECKLVIGVKSTQLNSFKNPNIQFFTKK